MVDLMSLAMPIVLSAVLVFVVSSIIHMALTYHQNDFQRLPNEDEFLEVMRRGNVTPGDYAAPYCSSSQDMKNPVFLEKTKRGPNAVMTIWAGGDINMGPMLGQWFLFILIVSLFTGYVLSRVFAPGADYMTVFRIAGTVAFMGYSLGCAPAAIWYKKSWGTTLRSMFDGLVYGLVTAGTFGWLWP